MLQNDVFVSLVGVMQRTDPDAVTQLLKELFSRGTYAGNRKLTVLLDRAVACIMDQQSQLEKLNAQLRTVTEERCDTASASEPRSGTAEATQLFEPVPDFADLVPVAEWREWPVNSDDGHGCWVGEHGMLRHGPSVFGDPPAWATHVAWFNK